LTPRLDRANFSEFNVNTDKPMSPDPIIASNLRKMMTKVSALSVPRAWLKALGNHTTAIVLADILSAYLGQGSAPDRFWEGRELLVNYSDLASRLGIADRSVSRAVDLLTKLGCVAYHRKDRVLGGKKIRNVVGVIPNLGAIAKLSAIKAGDILAAPPTESKLSLRTDRAGAIEPKPAAPDSSSLTDRIRLRHRKPVAQG
jgi:hypothetical protein